MFRKSLFLGLMLLLGAALVSLVVQGRRQEKKQAATRIVEVVKQFKPTPTRVIAPQDLEIVGPDNPARFAIRNHGTVTYRNSEVEFVYLGRDGRVLENRTVKIDKMIPPGQEVSVENAASDKIPEGSKRTLLKIRSAELVSPATSSDVGR